MSAARRDVHGRPLKPGVNVDKVDIEAGLKQAAEFGYGDERAQMVAMYALRRHARGEEEGARYSAVHNGIDLTSWNVILSAAIAAAQKEEL